MVVKWGSDTENTVGDNNIGRQGRPNSSVLQSPVEPSIVVQEQNFLA